MSDQMKIVLSHRAPVIVNDAEWPIIASSGQGGATCQDKHWSLTVRQHADGRAIVYGKMTGPSSYNSADIYAGRYMDNQPTQDEIAYELNNIGCDLEAPEDLIANVTSRLPGDVLN